MNNLSTEEGDSDEDVGFLFLDSVECNKTEMTNEDQITKEEVERVITKKKKQKKKKRNTERRTNEEPNVVAVVNETEIDPLSWEVHMPAVNGEIHYKVVTGADVTIIPEEDLEKLGLHRDDVKPTRKKLFGPGKQQLRCF